MTISLRKLLQNPSLNLKLAGNDLQDSRVEEMLDREFEWLHATDMIDPVQFLGPAEVILTLGWQFPIQNPASPAIPKQKIAHADLERIYEDYVALVAAHGVIGIGFGSDVVHKGIPRLLIEACARHDLVLFDVPYEISFMDILQESARLVQRNQSERQDRSLRAQKAIATAATRRDGVTSTLRETARQLGCGVSLYDSLGHLATFVSAPQGQDVDEKILDSIVQELLNEGQRFRSVQVTPDIEAVLQMLGEPTDPSGVLVLTLSQGFDDVSRNVLSSVLALLSVSLEQNQVLASLHNTLRQAMLQLLLSGEASVTRHIAEQVWGDLPEPPLTTFVGRPNSFDVSRILPRIETITASLSVPVFFAQHRDFLVLLAPEEDTAELIHQFGPLNMYVGHAPCDRWHGLEVSIEEAQKASDHALRRGITKPIPFAEMWEGGIANLIDASDAAHIARRTLGPLAKMDGESGSALIETLRVWLSHHGRTLPASRYLGIHRHTLLHRLKRISELTQLDLDNFETRADLTIALRYFRDWQSVEQNMA